jgi:mono/diheme cytochrome c family protein
VADMRRRTASVLLASLLLGLAGCGGGGEGDGGADGANDTGAAGGSQISGADVFAEAGCGGCHTLAAAGSTGTIGPNLDEASPSADQVEQMVRNGGGAMPSFEGDLDDDQIAAVAAFVSESTN